MTAHGFCSMHDILHSFPTYLIEIFTPFGFLYLQNRLKMFGYVLRFYQLNTISPIRTTIIYAYNFSPTIIILHKMSYNCIVFFSPYLKSFYFLKVFLNTFNKLNGQNKKN